MLKIEFNNMKKKWIASVGGKVIARSANRSYCERKAAEAGYSVNAPAEAPKKSEFSVQERFDFIEKFVSLIAKRKLNSFILTGDAGLGKTYTVTETLKDQGMEEDTVGSLEGDLIAIRGFSTAKALYRTLWENDGKVIIFDDCDSVFKDAIGANLLKAALGSEDKRVLSWGAEFPESEALPNRFEFTGRCIFISNLSITDFPMALQSRSFCVDLTLTTEEKLDRIQTVMDSIDMDKKPEVLNFLRKNADKLKELSIRSALNTLKLANDLGDDWERISLYSLTV